MLLVHQPHAGCWGCGMRVIHCLHWACRQARSNLYTAVLSVDCFVKWGFLLVLCSGVDVYTAVAGAVGALYGPLHGGANEAVLRMLERIGSLENIPSFIAGVKAKREKLFGFGHRVYKNFDPRPRSFASEHYVIHHHALLEGCNRQMCCAGGAM